MEMCQFRE